MIEQTIFQALTEGTHLVVFGAVHGNERCGTAAIRRAINALQSGEYSLKKGRVTFVPVANPRAYAAKQRFIERNLNRYFYPKPEAQRRYYEDALDPILCAILDNADALLDLHSYQSEGEAFCFLGTTSQAEIDYSRTLGVDAFIYGWAEAFSKNATEEQRKASIGTTDYTRLNGRGAVAVTVECGNHHHPQNVEVGYEAILRALSHFDMLEPALPSRDISQQQCIEMRQVFYKEKEGQLVRPFRHLDEVRAGEIIACYDDGQEIPAPEDGVLVLPKTQTDFAIGAEWFYFGVKSAFPSIVVTRDVKT